MTVKEFYDMILLNENHNIRVKSQETDSTICEIEDVKSLEESRVKEREIVGFATDWVEKIYIIWI